MKPKTQRKKTAFDNLNAEFEKLKASNTSAEDYKAKFEQNEFAQQLVRHWVKETAGTMVNLSRTKALCFDKTDAFGNVVGSVPLKGAYEQAIAEAVTAVTSGTTEFNTATARAVERLGGSGVKVTYGSGVNRSLSAMIRQNLLYSAKQAAQSYDEYIGQKLGCDGFEVDAHSGCRSSHAFMQGKMYSYNGRKVINGVVYNDGTAALKAMNDYGRLHFKMNVILGVSEPRYTKSELERIHRETTETIEYKGKEKTLYEWKQTQRTLERGIHTEQQKANMYDAAGMRRKADECRNKAKVCRNAYDEMCAKAGLTPHPERMRNYKGVDISGKSGIIEEREALPRKMKSGLCSVDWSAVQSSEYSKKFSKLSPEQKVASAIETRAKWALSNRDGKTTEEIYAVDLKNGREISRITDQHYSSAVKRTSYFTRELNKADETGQRVLLLHNHPRGLPPSVSDINALFENKNVCGITIGHNGSVYYYTRPNKKIPNLDYEVKLRHFKEYDEITNIEKALGSLQEEFGFTFKKL